MDRLHPLHRTFLPAARLMLLPIILAVIFTFKSYIFVPWLGINHDPAVMRVTLSLGFGLFIFGLSCLWQGWGRWVYLVAISLLLDLFFVSQYIYYRYAGAFIQASALKYAGSQAGSVTGSIQTFIDGSVTFFVVDLAVILVAFLLFRKPPRVAFRWRAIIALSGLLAFAISFTYLLSDEYRTWHAYRRLITPYDTTAFVERVGIVGYSVSDITHYVLSQRHATQAQIQEVKDFAASRPAPGAQPANFGVAKGQNIILVQLESFENFLVDRTIAGQEITPNLNALARDNLYFSNYFYQAGPGTTADAEFTTQTGFYYLPDQVAFSEHASTDYTAMPETLAAHGYATMAMHADDKNFWNRANMYPQLGYERFYNLDDFRPTRRVNLGISATEGTGDSDFYPQVETFLEQQKQPFLATVISLSSHTPFQIPPDLKTLKLSKGESGLSDYQLDYIQSAHYADAALGAFIARLKADGLYDKSVIALYGDHKSFSTSQSDTAFAKFLGLDSFNDYTYLRHSQVPLIIHAAGLSGEQTAPASHIDVYPTLMNLLGIPVPRSVIGQDVLSVSAPVVVKRGNANGISQIIAKDRIYESSTDGVFEHGRCLALPSQVGEPVDNCKTMYDTQTETVRVSDLAVKYNLMELLR